jgi:hypothetical protein
MRFRRWARQAVCGHMAGGLPGSACCDPATFNLHSAHVVQHCVVVYFLASCVLDPCSCTWDVRVGLP